MPAFDPRDRSEVGAARGNAGYGGRGGNDARSGGLGLSGARGTLSQQQDRINQANARRAGNIAPGVKEGFVSGMNLATARRTPNPTTTRPLTPHNLWEAFKALPMSPFGAVNVLGGAVGVPGMGPQYEGPMGMANSPGDYDPTNRFGTNESALGLAARPKIGMSPTGPALRRPVGPTGPMMPRGWRPGVNLQSGLPGYSTYRPGYDFISGPMR